MVATSVCTGGSNSPPDCCTAMGSSPIVHTKNNGYPIGSPYLLVREAGREPARPQRTLEPESSESTNSTTRAYLVRRFA